MPLCTHTRFSEASFYRCFAIFLLALIVAGSKARAQEENNFWALGNGMALDWSSGAPRAASSACRTIEGTAAQSGKDGQLKWYSDGFAVYNRYHRKMPNGDALISDGSMTQGVCIVPHPADTNLFYLFVLGAAVPGAIQLRYTIVDMRLDGGMGDVTAIKNVLLDDSLSEKMIVTRGTACTYWLVVHSGVQPEFHAFQITDTGLSVQPVVSATPFIGDGYYGIGEMKVSADNQKLVLANWRSRGTLTSVELFHFDSSSGKLSDYTLIDSSLRYGVYGVSFSPDGSKLYAAYGEDEPRPPYALLQYDLNLLPDWTAMRASRTTLATAFNWAGMRLYRGKIYLIKPATLSMVICAIEDPNQSGTACRFRDSLLVLDRVCFSLGNPVPETPAAVLRKQLFSVCESARLQGASAYRYYLWSDGASDSVRYAAPHTSLWVQASNGACAASVTDTFIVQQRVFSAAPLPDVYSCRDTLVVLKAGLIAEQYAWSTGAVTESAEVRESGWYTYTAQSGDCLWRDTVLVRLGDCVHCFAIPNAFTPNGDGRNDLFRPQCSCPLLRYEMKIFNRYGEQLYSGDKVQDGWDGSYRGRAEDAGVYFYLIRATFDRPGAQSEIFSGDLTLIR